jgi:hypothetical protein
MRQHLNGYPLVIVHNYLESFQKFLSRSKDENTLLDRRFNGDQALFWLGDSKLVISSAPIEDSQLLRERWEFEDTKTISPRKMSVSLSKDILRESHLREAILEMAGQDRKVALVPYATTSEFLHLADTLREEDGLDIHLPESTPNTNLWIRDYLDSKVGFRSVLSQVSEEKRYLNIPHGFTCADLEQVIEAADWFRRRGKGCVVKANIGGSGVGNLFLPIETIQDKEIIANQVKSNQFLSQDIFIVEELIISPGNISPSMEFYLPPKDRGAPQFTYLCNQLFERSGRFAGVVISKELEGTSWWPNFSKQGYQVARRLQQVGYTGTFDLDAVVDPDDNCFIVEVNSRRTGGTYAHEFMEHNFGPEYMDHFTVLSENKEPSGNCRSLKELETAIDDLLYPIDGEPHGVIVLLTSMLPMGYFGYLVLGSSIGEVKALRSQMISRLHPDPKD